MCDFNFDIKKDRVKSILALYSVFLAFATPIKFSFYWLSLYLPVKSDILKNSQSLKSLIFIRTKTKEKKNEYI